MRNIIKKMEGIMANHGGHLKLSEMYVYLVYLKLGEMYVYLVHLKLGEMIVNK